MAPPRDFEYNSTKLAPSSIEENGMTPGNPTLEQQREQVARGIIHWFREVDFDLDEEPYTEQIDGAYQYLSAHVIQLQGLYEPVHLLPSAGQPLWREVTDAALEYVRKGGSPQRVYTAIDIIRIKNTLPLW